MRIKKNDKKLPYIEKFPLLFYSNKTKVVFPNEREKTSGLSYLPILEV